MVSLFRFGCCLLLLSAGLVPSAPVARAQAPAAAPRSYSFLTLTVTVIQSPYKNDCRLLLTPAFQGKSELKLEEEYTLSSDKYRAAAQSNTLLLNKLLSDLTEAGWELADTHATQQGAPSASVTRYLLRKAKN